MENYPDLYQWVGTRMIQRSGIMERIATNGTVRLRAFQSTVKYDISIIHAFLSSSDRTTLLNFYTANKTGSFLFTAAEDGVQRYVRFAPDALNIRPMQDCPTLFEAVVNLRET